MELYTFKEGVPVFHILEKSDAQPLFFTEKQAKKRIDYYPYGMKIPLRHYKLMSYEYGFNGMLSANDIANNNYTTDFRELDTRLGGRWWSQDPIVKPWESPYAGFSNNPIVYSDPSGLDPGDKATKEQQNQNVGAKPGETEGLGGDLCTGCGANGEDTWGIPDEPLNLSQPTNALLAMDNTRLNLYAHSESDGTGMDGSRYRRWQAWVNGLSGVNTQKGGHHIWGNGVTFPGKTVAEDLYKGTYDMTEDFYFPRAGKGYKPRSPVPRKTSIPHPDILKDIPSNLKKAQDVIDKAKEVQESAMSKPKMDTFEFEKFKKRTNSGSNHYDVMLEISKDGVPIDTIHKMYNHKDYKKKQ